MSILSDNDWAFFRKNGYVIVPNAVPQDHLDATIEATFDFLGMAPDRPEDWYRAPLRTNGLEESWTSFFGSNCPQLIKMSRPKSKIRLIVFITHTPM